MKRIFAETDKSTEVLLSSIQTKTKWSMKRCVAESLLLLGEKIGIVDAGYRYKFEEHVTPLKNTE